MNGENRESSQEKVPFWISSRFGVSILLFLGILCTYSMKVNINMSIVCMVNHTALELDKEGDPENTTTLMSRDCNILSNNSSKQKDGSFVWNRSLQSNILGAFLWPYAIFQVPLGVLVTKYGARKVFGSIMIMASLLTVSTPELSKVSYIATIVIRISLGILLAGVFVSCQYILGRWAPLHERSRHGCFCFAGVECGILITYVAAGQLCHYESGWSYIFYLSGISSFIWSVFWIVIVRDTPQQSKRISDAEKNYIYTYLQNAEDFETQMFKKMHIPWRCIFTSVPVYAIIVANFASDWAVDFMITFAPSYLNDVFNFDVEYTGLISALPSVPHFIFVLIGGWLSDFIQNRFLSRRNTRKLFTTISMVIPGILLVILGYVHCSYKAIAIVLLIMNMSFRGFRYAGFFENALEIAPYHAGIIFGIANSAGAVGGYLSTVVTGNITGNSTREEWQICFYISSAVEVFGALFYIIFASSDVKILNKGTNTSNHIEIIRWQRSVDSYQSETISENTHM